MAAIASGVVMVVLAVPEVQLDLTADVMWEFVLPDPRCWVYLLCLPVVLGLYLKLVLPRYKTRHCLGYLLLCNMIKLPALVTYLSPP